MDVRILVVPYVVGREAEGMGAGPLSLEEAAAAALGTDDVRRISRSDPWTTEVAACFELNRRLAEEIASARADGVLPVVLTGNCHSQQAVIAGLGMSDLRLVWLDCHGDFNTPETTETGFFDGYGLAMVVGDCWQALCATVPGFAPAARGARRARRGARSGRRRARAPRAQRDPGHRSWSTFLRTWVG